MHKQFKLSILDQSLVPKGGKAVEALQNTVALAKLAERWGYHRFWVSEHHNLASIAGSSPEVLMAKIASETKHIRVGSGGVMLPNHSALKVAENFRTLEGLFPNRIDLGIGRAPGGDKISASFLNPSNNFAEQSYLRQLDHLQILFKDEAGTEYGRLLAVPQVPTVPQQWILSSSGGSAKIAAQYGMGLAVAKFINGQASSDIVEIYKSNFEPSAQFPKPKVAVSLVVLCTDTDEKAMQLRKCINHQFINMSKHVFEGISTYEDLKDLAFSHEEKLMLQSHMGKVVTGTPEQLKKTLSELALEFDADEIIIAAWAAKFEDRIRSYELLAQVFELDKSLPIA